MKKKYITEIIGKDYQQWNNENIIIRSSTNTGKSTFICDVLVPWAASRNKTVLYLVNRTALEEQIRKRISGYNNVVLSSCQKLESYYRQDIAIGTYDYIIVDECHYFTSDSMFNRQTDYSFYWICQQTDCVKIWMSATGNIIFNLLPHNKEYFVDNSHDEIDAIYFYKYKKQLSEIINHIIKNNHDEKILVFVDSIKRLCEMHLLFGDKASYTCSKSNRQAKQYDFIEYNVVKDFKFDKQILFTTKAMDNGIDIKEASVKHIISEILDVESAIQAIGRKRPINSEDHYSIYFLIPSKQRIHLKLNDIIRLKTPVDEYERDKQIFISNYQNDKRLIKYNDAFYGCVGFDGGNVKINSIFVVKLKNDFDTFNEIEVKGYEHVLLNRLGMFDKVKKLEIDADKEDTFVKYLKSLQGVKLFKDEQKELKEAFRLMLGSRCRTLGLKTLNAQLLENGYANGYENGYPFEIVSVRDWDRKSETYDKTYWMVKSTVVKKDNSATKKSTNDISISA